MDERKRNSKNQESKVAKELSGKVTPASGALWGAKADVRSDIFLVECKTTISDRYRLTFNVWNKIYLEAIKDGLRIPVMCIDLLNGKKRYAVMCTKDLPSNLTLGSPLCSGSTTKSFNVIKDSRFLLEDKGKCYYLSAIEWNVFLGEVVSLYD